MNNNSPQTGPSGRQRPALHRTAIAIMVALAGLIALPSAANAETGDARQPDAHKTDVRSTDVRPDRDIEVLKLKCTQTQPGELGVACEWREAQHPRAVGYQLWRIVNRNEREAVWRGPLGTTANTSRVPEGTLVARYAVLAVDENGRIVGRSRISKVRLERADRVTPVRISNARPAVAVPLSRLL